MIASPASFPPRRSSCPDYVIGITGLGDRHRPESAIDITGIRNMTINSTSGEWEMHYKAALRGGQPPKPYEFAFLEFKNNPNHKSEKGWARGV